MRLPLLPFGFRSPTAMRAGPFRAGPPSRTVFSAALRLDHLVERQLAARDLVEAVVGQAGVAVLVDRVGAENALAILRREDRVHDGLPRQTAARTGPLDGVQHQRHR